MTPIVNIDTTVIQSLPFSKRLTKWICFLQSVCYPVKWLYNNVLTNYMNGTVAPNYAPGVTYSLGQQVIFNYSVWESVINNNTGNTPNLVPAYSPTATYAVGAYILNYGVYYVCTTAITTPEPTFVPANWTVAPTAPWLQVNKNFIGAKERASYNGRYLSLTWALNRYFQTTFRQPPYPYPYGGAGTFSDIYITNYEPPITSFLSFTTETLTTDVYTTGTGGEAVFTEYVNDAGSTFICTIHIPVAVYADINTDPKIANSTINQFIEDIIPAGLGWSIVTY